MQQLRFKRSALLFYVVTHTAPPSPRPVTTYLAAHLVVMEVHERAGVLLDLAGVNEHLGEAQAIADVRRAAAPLPALALAVVALLLLVAGTVAQVPLGAGRRDGVGHARRYEGVGECRLFAS